MFFQDLARREQSRRDSDAWLTVQRLKRAKLREDRETVRVAKAQGRDWTDPEGGVEMGMGRQEIEERSTWGGGLVESAAKCRKRR